MKRILLLTVVCLLLLVKGYGQGRIVTGKVISAEDSSPVPGASIIVKGTTVGTVSDAEGAYSVNVPQGSNILVVSFIGYKGMELEIGNQSVLDIKLENDATQLEEVVVTGYTTQTQRELTGSVASVKGDKIERVPLGSFDQALQGQVPGVLIQSNSGQPGAAAQVRIRGTGSLNGSNQPLYIMDGIEITANDFSTINQADFENISVLKDASATAIYGSRGANGVIVITTKRGKTGAPKINYDFQYGTSDPPESKLKLMNTQQKLDYEMANGNPLGWTQADLDRLSLINTDWTKVLFQKGKTQSHTLNVSGATDKTSYFISGSMFDQTGTVPNTLLKRYTGRINVASGVNTLTFGLTSTFGYSEFTNTNEANTSIGAPLNAVRWCNPYETPYDDQGEYTDLASGQPNALEELLENSNVRQQLKGIGQVFAAYELPFLKGLTIKTSWGGDYTANERAVFVDGTTATGAGTPGQKGSFTRQFGKRFRTTGTTSISYTKNIGTEHSLSVSLFNEVVKSKSSSFFFTGFGLGGPFENEAGITPGNNTNGFIPQVGGNATDGVNGEGVDFRGGPSALLSYFATVNYGFRDKYYLSVAARRDGSSRFGSNYRYANFASIGANWIISDEDFMSGLKDVVFNELKYKISYGSSGNQAGIGTFQARELYGRGVYNGVSGLVQTQLENSDLRWERKTIFNTGLEMASLQGRLKLSFEYYNTLTTDLFLNKPLSETTGYTSLTSNLGELQNRGFEISLSADVVKAGDFLWSVNANFTRNKNTVKKLFEGQDEIIAGLILTRPGESTNTFYMVRYAGVNPTNGNALYLTKDGEETEAYDPNDRVIVGSAEVPYFGGFGTTLSFKGIELSGLFSYVMGNQIYNNDRNNVENPAYLWDNINVDLANEWRTPGQVTDIPRPGNTYRSNTTRFLEDGDFVRLRNVMLSYSLPKSILSKIKLNNIRVYAQGQNLLTFTDFRSYDPEITGVSLTGAQYPALKTITFGASIGF
jgi:TonB-dependent starch-binding outer membrane protein SusC